VEVLKIHPEKVVNRMERAINLGNHLQPKTVAILVVVAKMAKLHVPRSIVKLLAARSRATNTKIRRPLPPKMAAMYVLVTRAK
jgi:hypothetical protein